MSSIGFNELIIRSAEDDSYSLQLDAEDDSYSGQLDANQSVYLPPISPKTSGESLYRFHDHAAWADLHDKYRERYGHDPEDRPNFKAFLRKLRPSRRGFIECRSCREKRDGEFLPGRGSIGDHFRLCHLGNIQHADKTQLKDQVQKAIEDLMNAPQTKDIICQLLTRCEEVQAKRGKGAERDAAREEEYTPLDDGRTKRAEELDERRSHRVALYQRNNRMPQWAVLRELRKKFYQQHRQFRQYAASAGPPIIRPFAKRCRRPGGLLRLGIVTFRKILRRRAPTTLLQVFAFISLSYAMAAVMHDRGVQVEFTPNVSDFFTWRQSIRRESKWPIFDQIVATWFRWLDPSPGLCGWFNSLPVQSDAPLESYTVSRILDILAEKHPQPDQLVQTSMKEVIMRLIKAGSADEAFNFSAFLHINRPSTTDQSGTQLPVQQGTSDAASRDQRDTSSGGNEVRVAKHGMAVSVRGTVMFIRAQLFMICEWPINFKRTHS